MPKSQPECPGKILKGTPGDQEQARKPSQINRKHPLAAPGDAKKLKEGLLLERCRLTLSRVSRSRHKSQPKCPGKHLKGTPGDQEQARKPPQILPKHPTLAPGGIEKT